MKPSEELLRFFQFLLSHPDLFSDQHRNELEDILFPIADDSAAMNEAISAWCLERSEIEEAMWAVPDSDIEISAELSDVRFPRNAQPDAKARSQDEKLQKADILNAIRQAVPSSLAAPLEK